MAAPSSFYLNRHGRAHHELNDREELLQRETEYFVAEGQQGSIRGSSTASEADGSRRPVANEDGLHSVSCTPIAVTALAALYLLCPFLIFSLSFCLFHSPNPHQAQMISSIELQQLICFIDGGFSLRVSMLVLKFFSIWKSPCDFSW